MALAAEPSLLVDFIRPFTKTPPTRAQAMVEALMRASNEHLPGDIAECGVWRGGNIMLARMLCPTRVCWLYDTFVGMPLGSRYDFTRGHGRKKVGKDAVSIVEVQNNFRKAGLFDDKLLRFVEGMVEDTLRNPNNVPRQLAVLRLDTDYWASTKIELEVLWPRLVSGGTLLIDDYGHWKGCQKAVDEFFQGSVELQEIDYTCRRVIKQ